MRDKIVHVRFVWPPIPDRAFDWCAYFDEHEEDGPYGYGKTPEGALEELVQALHDATKQPEGG